MMGDDLTMTDNGHTFSEPLGYVTKARLLNLSSSTSGFSWRQNTPDAVWPVSVPSVPAFLVCVCRWRPLVMRLAVCVSPGPLPVYIAALTAVAPPLSPPPAARWCTR